MNNEDHKEICKDINHSEIQEYMKDTYGIEVLINEFLPSELVNQGYKKLSLEEFHYISPLFQLAPQLVVEKVNNVAIEQAFMAATENSYKCLLDPSMHLATIKGSSDVFLGAGLDNATNQVKGQARWLRNDVVLSISTAPQIALNAFNALSVVTGQYFMAQVNANLIDIKDNIDGVKNYIDLDKQSKLEASLQELYEIIKHIEFIKKDTERTRAKNFRIEEIRNIARCDIGFYKNLIDKIKREALFTDKEKKITEKTDEIKKYLVQYHYAVYVLNLSQMLQIYLSDITDIDELNIFRDETSDIINQYKIYFDETVTWVKKYLDCSNCLNKVSKVQIFMTLVSGVGGALVGKNIISTVKTASLVNDLFNDSRDKKKQDHIEKNNEYQLKMNDMELIDSSISAIDKYINCAIRRTEIVSVEGEYYIKYIETEK